MEAPKYVNIQAQANLTRTIAARRGLIDAKNASSTQALGLEETNRQNILYAAQANNSQLLNLRVGIITAVSLFFFMNSE